jgi:hypothetical protein
MSLIKRLFGSAKAPEPEALPAEPEAATPSQIDPAPDSRTFQLDSAQAGTRRELVRVMTRDTLRTTGIPEGWVESQVLLELGRGEQTFVHLRLIVKQWDVRLLKYAVAFQNRLTAEIEQIDPSARQWLLSVAWQYQVGETCPFPDLPEPAAWQAPAASLQSAPAPAAVMDLLLEDEEPDEVSEDLARLFAIRDANLPAHGGR